MTSAELAQLEENLGVTLPEEYKRIALDNPFAGLHTADYELCDDFTAVLGENRYVRDHGFFRQVWPPDWFIIGTDGCGSDYFIMTAPFDGRVYFADQREKLHTDDVSKCRFHDSFDKFIEAFREVERGIADEGRLRDARAAQRKWWQFWILKT